MTPLAEGALLRAATLAPAVPIDALAPGGLLVLVPHPDDETLGCGAALSAAVAAGRDAHVVVVTDGAGSHPRSRRWPRARVAAQRVRELRAALDVLGEGRITHETLDRPDQGSTTPSSPGMPACVARLATLMRRRGLRSIWTTWEGDPHPDHVDGARLAQALGQAVRDPDGGTANVVRFPVWGRFVETDIDRSRDELVRFVPEATWQGNKARALACHRTQTTSLIDDDPDGFVMPLEMQRHFIEHDELFIRRRAS